MKHPPLRVSPSPRLRVSALLLCALCGSITAQTPTESVLKIKSSDRITEDLKIPSGRTFTIESGATFSLFGSSLGTLGSATALDYTETGEAGKLPRITTPGLDFTIGDLLDMTGTSNRRFRIETDSTNVNLIWSKTGGGSFAIRFPDVSGTSGGQDGVFLFPSSTGLHSIAISGYTNIFTRLQTITQGTANEGIIASTGLSLTGSDATNMIDLAGTWNTSGNPTVIKANITNTASGTTAKLIDMQVNSGSAFTFYKTGDIILGGTTPGGGTPSAATSLMGQWISTTTLEFLRGDSAGSTACFRLRTNGFGPDFPLGIQGCGGWIYMGAQVGNGVSMTTDLLLTREAAAVFQLGNDVNGDAVDQTIKAADGITGTDKNGGDLTLKGGDATGSGTSAIILSTPITGGGSGTTARTAAERARISGDGVTIGASGTAINRIIDATATLDFDLSAVTTEDKTITVTGAADGDDVLIGVPNGSITTTSVFFGWVSAADTVTIRCRTAAAGENPASGTFSATVIKN